MIAGRSSDKGTDMKRLSMRICTLVCISLSLLCMGCGDAKAAAGHSHVKVHEESLSLGLNEPMDIVFIADTHISLCDDRDKDVEEKAALRYLTFLSPDGLHADEMFAEEMDYVKSVSPDLLILGGDIVDSAMYASIDYVKDMTESAGAEYAYGMGNHDFEYGAEYYTDRAYEEYLPRLYAVSDTDAGYQVKEYDELTILIVDDDNNQVTEGALDKLKELCAGDKPVIVCTHVPIEPDTEYADTLMTESIAAWGAYDDGRSRVLLGYHSCIPNDITAQFIELIKSDDSPVKLVISGHIHFYNKSNLTQALTQIVTGAGFEGDVIHLHIE